MARARFDAMMRGVKSLRATILFLALLALHACGNPSTIIVTQVGEDSWSTMKPTDVQLRLGTLDGGELVIARGDKEIARGPAAKGTRLAVPMDDRACEAIATNTYESTSTGVRKSMRREPGDPKPQNRDLVATTIRGLTVELRCADGPTPGSDADDLGAKSRPSLPWGLPALVLGLICGLLARPDGRDGARMARSGTFGILAFIAAGVCASAMLEGAYAITYGILFGAWALAGIVGGRLAEPGGKHTAIAFTTFAVAGPWLLAVIWPMWTIGAPILALLTGGVLGLIALVIAVSIKPTY